MVVDIGSEELVKWDIIFLVCKLINLFSKYLLSIRHWVRHLGYGILAYGILIKIKMPQVLIVYQGGELAC